ncbi:MAG: DUF2281 domain-containing protein [Magnetococcales bacterium]|nr:DUF2281 domain-containing protein [Magnetococcales bacterium]
MGYANLLTKLQSLPPEKQAEVFDFVEFLASQSPTATNAQPSLDAEKAQEKPTETFSGPLAALRARVATQYGDMQPMSRKELYDRP